MRKALLVAALLLATAPIQAQASSQALDAAVLRAINSGDMRHARDLATTPQHWEWINGASAPARRPTYMESRQNMANSAACKDAQRSAQLASNMIKPDWAQVSTLRESARIACGY